jgi:hypothetical protein
MDIARHGNGSSEATIWPSNKTSAEFEAGSAMEIQNSQVARRSRRVYILGHFKVMPGRLL